MSDTRAKPMLETVRYTRMRVHVTCGPDLGASLERAGRSVTLGTSESADFRLSDETVSRVHCEITLSEHGFRVRDCESTNGIYIDGIRVYDIASVTPVALTLGETTLAVTPLAEVESRERAKADRFGPLIGGSPRMRELFALLARVAPTDLPILIEGETGTGKEVVAQAIHQASGRAHEPFVVFDCSVVAASLMESDLFGHERGAFTTAHARRIGALEEAQRGTLFLDEIGELPLELQQKLLRCLQSGEFRRVGGNKLEKVDVRVIAATNRNLKTEVANGRFREDLYYRLEGVPIQVPALRERLDDIPLLAAHFIAQAGPAPSQAKLPAHILEMFRAHRWPGNVRELANVVRRMLVLPDWIFPVDPKPARAGSEPPEAAVVSAGELLRVANALSTWQQESTVCEGAQWLQIEATRRMVQDAFERDFLKVLRRLSSSNRTRAAGYCGVTRQAIQRLLKKHELDWVEDDNAQADSV